MRPSRSPSAAGSLPAAARAALRPHGRARRGGLGVAGRMSQPAATASTNHVSGSSRKPL